MKQREKQSLFSKRVYAVVRRIKRGQVLSYKEVARRAGRVGAARAVGTLMKKIFWHPKLHATALF